MTMPEVVDFITGYAKHIAAPVQTGTTVTSVRRTDDGYRVTTDSGEWQCRTVVLATGAFNVPRVPAFAEAVPGVGRRRSRRWSTATPSQLAEGGVLVVGASATGVQIAHEIQRSGRPVTLAVGEHVRGPRALPGSGHPLVDGGGRRARRALRRGGRHRAGPPRAVDAARRDRPSAPPSTSTRSPASACSWSAASPASATASAQFSGSLRNKCELADLKLDRLLDTIDEWATANGMDDDDAAAAPVRADRRARAADARPRSHQRRDPDRSSGRPASAPTTPGSTCRCSTPRAWSATTAVSSTSPGMYLIGMPFLRRRKSSFIDGARLDAEDLVDHLARYLDRQAGTRSPPP